MYRAEQSTPRREVALKVVRGSLTEALRSRFQFEVEILARLEHPTIARLFATGRTTAGEPWFAMERVRGVTLDEYVRQHEVSRSARLRLFLELCRGVEYAHARGVVHRDLKPANVLVDAEGDPKILDFGIARSVEGGSARATLTGQVIGTPAFMSPEQAAGDADVDHRCDVYSLGVLLHELLCGEVPLEVDGLAPLQALRVVQEDEPPPLYRRDPSLAGDLSNIVTRALEKRPQDRYQTVAEFAADVRAHLQHRPIRARPPTTAYVLAKFCRRNRGPVTAVATTLLVLAAGLVTSLLLLDRSKFAEARAETKATEANLARQSLQELTDRYLGPGLWREAREDLWPVGPERADGMAEWIEQAEALQERLESYRVQLATFGAQSQGTAARLAPGQTTPKARATEDGSSPQVSTQAISRDTLTHLLEVCAPLFEEAPTTVGTLAEMRRRLVTARELERRTVGDHEDAWAEAIVDVEFDERFDGLVLAPQIGLVPLRADPETGLWEFWHVLSGERPQLDAEDRWIVAAETGMVLVLLPPGEVRLGDPEHVGDGSMASPSYQTEVTAFFCAKYELTQGQAARCGFGRPSFYGGGWQRNSRSGNKGRIDDSHPVENVSWEECVEFLHRVELELPTEIQWEYAARAGTDDPWWIGSESRLLRDAANVADLSWRAFSGNVPYPNESWDDGEHLHAPVGSYAANPFGLYDTAGNVSEICWNDYYQYELALTDGELRTMDLGNRKGRAYRGGSFERPAAAARASYRTFLRHYSGDRLASVGVRPVRLLD